MEKKIRFTLLKGGDEEDGFLIEDPGFCGGHKVESADRMRIYCSKIIKITKDMSWGVQLTTDIYVSRVLKKDVKEKIEENEELISMREKELHMIAASNPRDIASDIAREEGDIIEELRIKVDGILQSYRESLRENQLLYIILEEIDKAEDC